MTLRHRFRVALPVLVLVAGAVSIPGSSARAERPWRSLQAPSETVELSDYLIVAQTGQPPVGRRGGSRDSESQVEPDVPPSQGNIPPVTKQPGGGAVPDSAKNTIFNQNQGALQDTLMRIGNTNVGETPPPPPGARRGVLGLHPLAILVGLIALNIFVVTTVAK